MRAETEIQKVICQYLTVKRYYVWRNNNTGIFDPTTERFRKTPKGFKKGIADIFVLTGHYTVALEVKSEKGRQSPEQKEFEEAWVKSDFRQYHIVRSIDDVIDLGL